MNVITLISCCQQKIFKWNSANRPGAEYQLTELELPSTRTSDKTEKPVASISTIQKVNCLSLRTHKGY